MTDTLDGRVCLVTGGATGLGRVFATALAKVGASVVIADIIDGTEAANAIGGTFVETDVTDPTQAQRAVSRCLDLHGRLDVLINNAALYATLPMQGYREIEQELFSRVLEVNLIGAFNMIRAAGPSMEEAGAGKIVNVTSGTVYKGMPGMAHYVASKGGLMALTRSLARELGAHGVTVNNLAPGLTLSDSLLANPEHISRSEDAVLASRALRRHGVPEDLTGALLFLSGPGSDFMTGQTIVVDGGSVNT